MYQTDAEFENEVRRIARLLWPSAEHDGAAMIDGQERDGVFETNEFVHVIESTTSRTKEKAAGDLEKIERLTKKLAAKHPDKFIKGWFVTLEEPTADQRQVFQKHKGRIIPTSYDQFRTKLVDARSYLTGRDTYAFGSVRDPETGAEVVNLDYVPLDLISSGGDVLSAEDLALPLEQGNRFVLIGDYGAGKSSTVREIYHRLAKRFRTGKSGVFPLALNLRDHHGQDDPVEAIERHARRTGFSSPGDLVRGWRSGLATILLDGFDEIAAAGWAGKTKRLKDLRRISMELVRKFIRQTPQHVGILLSGRAHFFDSEREMKDALGLDNRFQLTSISEFSESQLVQFLRQRGWTQPIPSWIPSRPLLLAYLVSRGLLQQTLEAEAGSGPAVGWNSLIGRIAEREAEIEAGTDASTVRELIEHLASVARTSAKSANGCSESSIHCRQYFAAKLTIAQPQSVLASRRRNEYPPGILAVHSPIRRHVVLRRVCQ